MPKKNPSELRLDLESKDWVVIATGRGRRPDSFKVNKRRVKKTPSHDCAFCDLSKMPKPVMSIKQGEKFKGSKVPEGYTLLVVPNKYPSVMPSGDLNERVVGPYQVMDGVGFHEVIITRDHNKDISRLSIPKIKEVLDAYQERYLEFMNEENVEYISIFHNHGRGAGASIDHPHSQIVAIPVTDPDVRVSLKNSRKHYAKNKKCLHCDILDWERRDKSRIVYENEEFIAICPFASKMAFQTRIYPKQHLSYFERVTETQKELLAETFSAVTKKIRKGVGSPDYNFYLMNSPCDGRDYSHYHWHFDILPRTSIQAGFEFGAGIEVSTIEPEKAAGYLRKI